MKHTCLRRHVTAIVAVTAILAGMSAYADPVEDLVEFSAGTTARADEVNGNFNEVADAVNGNDMWIAALEAEIAELRTTLEAVDGCASLDPSDEIETIPFSAFLASSSDVNWNQSLLTGYGERGGASPTTFAYAPLQVRSGLRVESIELEYCDDTPDGRLILSLSQCPAFNEDGCVGFATVDTGEAEAPGCTFKTDVLDEPHTIDNSSNVYKFNLSDTSSGGGSLRIRAVRVFLRCDRGS